jgi:hypothetical protein
MLPDFPVEKAELSALWLRYLERRLNNFLGFFADLPYFSIHEGNRSRIIGEDGSIDEFDYQTIQSMLSIHPGEVPHLTREKVRERMDSIAQELARKMSKSFYATLDHITEQTGQVVDAGGRRFSKDIFLRGLRSVDLAFDSQGNPIMPALVMHPHMFGPLRDEVATWEQDAEFSAQMDRIIEQKREKWIARESRRRLTD